MNYFVRLERAYSCRNKAHEAAQKLACNLDRVIVDEDGKKKLIDKFKDDVRKVNEDHPRCHPLSLEIKRGYDKKTDDTIIEIESNFQVVIYQAK